MRSIAKLSLLFLLTTSLLLADDEWCCDEFRPIPQGYIPAIGAEWSHVSRTRDGGTKQHGNYFGGRASFDRIARYKLYYGVQAAYGFSTLEGHQGSGAKIRSKFTTGQIEGSVGYTFQSKCFLNPWITPILGYGYLYEKNAFKDPSPLHLTFTTRYQYVPFGILSGITVAENFGVGLNVRLRWPYDPKCKVTGDEENEDSTQLIEEKLGYRIEIPLLYATPVCCRSLLVGLTPFYELRHYGGKENHPFDFFETKMRLYGVNLQILYQF